MKYFLFILLYLNLQLQLLLQLGKADGCICIMRDELTTHRRLPNKLIIELHCQVNRMASAASIDSGNCQEIVQR